MKPRFLLSLFTLVTVAVIALADTATFTYDTAGRLTSASRNSTNVSTFQYDVSGNLTRSASYVVADSDQDGMADAWENLYFSDRTRDGLGDFDGDGMIDVAEFLAGTLPNSTNSLLRMDRTVTNTLVQTTVSWQSVSGKTYRVQFKNALTDVGWNDLPGHVTATGPSTSKIDTTTTGQPERFYRVQVVP